MKNYLFILTLVLCGMISCSPKEETAKQVDLSESIFQLNSDWENQNGEILKLEDLKGKTLVMVMIYTTCKTACPRLTAEMKELEASIGKYDSSKIRFVFVSIDPEVDTPEMMKAYLDKNGFKGEQWVFLRGDESNTREFANVLSVKYKQISPIDFSHSNIISVFSDQGVLAFQKEGLGIDITETVKEIQKQL